MKQTKTVEEIVEEYIQIAHLNDELEKIGG